MCIRDRKTTTWVPLRQAQTGFKTLAPSAADAWSGRSSWGLCGRRLSIFLSLIHISEPTRLDVI
eukprot:4989163-Prorocentrum_lima.AAC.1